MRIFQSILLSIAGLAAGLSISLPASAQAPSPPGIDPSSIPVRAASAQPLLGEEVLDANGVVASAQFVENRTCTIRGCRSFIFDMRSGALILNDRAWAPAYAPTGRGGQVIRVLPFAASERPGPAPDDKALETAPGIIKVTRAKAAGVQKPTPK